MSSTAAKPLLQIFLAAPRGFCAGVDRAIQIVEKSLEKYGAPVYVRHEIVHNRFVVDRLRSKGAVFVEELDEIPDDGRPVVFSAHGVPKSVPEAAAKRAMFYIDATCPLVTKVHNEAARQYREGRTVILIGHKGHPEVEGTLGQLPLGAVLLVENVADVKNLAVPDSARLAYCSQTTLSVDDTAEIVAALKEKYPAIAGAQKEDICYATTNRQAAVKELAAKVDMLFVIGSPNSSNSNRLAEVAKVYGCPAAFLVEDAAHIPWTEMAQQGPHTLGITAGASAPEILVEGVVAALKEKYDVTVEEAVVARESIVFNIPRILREAEDAAAREGDAA
jgi:4-hydroxy-3-methylbut-2-enyl diphosphate reductase